MYRSWKSVFELPGSGRYMMEANAGTGKTYTIAALYVKLIIEKKLTPSEMLVMTFTNKATAELRERIFSRLIESLALFERGEWDRKDSFLKDLDRHVKNREEAAQTLRSAISEFDDHQVTTIHGFCQKVLKEETLLTGTIFDLEAGREDLRLARAVERYWREFVHRHQGSDAGRSYINKLIALAENPAGLQRFLYPLFSKPYAELRAEQIGTDPLEYLGKLIALRKRMRTVWRESRSELMVILENSPVSRYASHLKSRIEKLEAFLEDESYKDDTFDQLKYFESAYLYNRDNYLKARKHVHHPRHTFFELCTAYAELVKEMEKLEGMLILEAYQDILKKVDDDTTFSDSISYDDLLKLVERALTTGSEAERLAARLRTTYPVALVDEFQDTDPLQYNIFDKIYDRKAEGDHVLYMIGDPKQAIYGFRGGDVFTYFQARHALEGPVYSLEKNYRSADTLIQAVNTLFGREKGLFYEEEIRYFHSQKGEAPHQTTFTIDGKPAEEFRLLVQSEYMSNKQEASHAVFDYVTRRARHLLDLAAAGRAYVGDRPLQAGDIAILVNNHWNAGEIKRRLKRLGTDAIIYSKENIYSTFEAARVRVVMEAILHPLSRKFRNRAVLSGFFGLEIPGLLALHEEDEEKEEFTQRLLDLGRVWEAKGFYTMFRKLLFEQEALVHLAGLDDSERVLTNLSHLAELLSVMELEEGLGPHELLQRFDQEIQTAEEDEEKALLLESDRNLVVISTVHASKGLQYPVVFCPSLWEGPGTPNGLVEYHSGEEFRLNIHLSKTQSESRKEAGEMQLRESIAEEIRKAYVAVTRAEHYCEVIWTSHTDAWKSGIGLPFLGRERFFDFQSGEKSAKDDLESVALEAGSILSRHPSGPIVIKEFEKEHEIHLSATGMQAEPPDREAHHFEPYRGRREIRAETAVESFTSLARQGGEYSHEPDYDQIMDHYSAAFQEETEHELPGIFSFPKGATPGTAIHKFFELDDFLFSEAEERDYTLEIDTILQEYGIEKSWTPVFAKMVREVSGALIPGLDLRAVRSEDQLKEMEFLFRTGPATYPSLMEIIRGGESRPNVSGPFGGGATQGAAGVGGAVKSGGNGDRWAGATVEGDTSPLNSMHHLMTGFIDLIVRQNGRYYILDYKSNYLGDTPEDYSVESLREEILRSDYDLQYHLYVVALVKYLRERMPGFNYEEHFGGVGYLFVRGMEADTDRGVWFHRPEEAVIQKLEAYLGGGA